MDNFFHQIVQKIIVILGLVPTLSVDERDIQLCSKYHNNCFKKTNIPGTYIHSSTKSYSTDLSIVNTFIKCGFELFLPDNRTSKIE